MRKSVFLKSRFDWWIEQIGSWIMFGKKTNQVILVEEYGSMVVAHIYLHTVPQMLKNKTLADSGIMSDHHLMVMMVKSTDEDARQANGNTILRPKDTIMVLGDRKTIREVFENVELTQNGGPSPVYVHNK
jgi:Trk K+ transport system NAD-binding subunit